MSQKNETQATFVTEFFIVGFPGLQPEYYNLIGAVFFSIYIIVIGGNSSFILLFVTETSLHKPMYIILLNLALSDIGYCTVALPKLISRYWFNNGFISFQLCLMQSQFIHYFGTLNSFIMMTMALDRYLAICFPLRYPVLMTTQTMKIVSGFFWVSSMIYSGISTIMTSKLPFCGPNRIMNCFCDTTSMNSLACSDVTFQSYIATSVATFVLVLPFSLIVFSYTSIVVSVVTIVNNQGMQKTFSTCATQLCIISIYYIPRFFVYISPYIPNLGLNTDQKLSITVCYTLFPAMANPLIYCLRHWVVILKMAIDEQGNFRVEGTDSGHVV
ncbi:olfactory receptor 1E16-like [Salminus brasiliensis]|uniref:olfactory receptor 1E16-like n=1 Tax=Salminus brasiliensis TaxID=930266 RepID=UPI003B82FC8E